VRPRLVAFLALVACGGAEPKGWLADRPRVLGVRVEPGQLSWLLTVPRAGWSLATCAPPEGRQPSPACPNGVAARVEGTSDDYVVTTPVLAGGEALVLAAFCEEGTPALDPTRFTATCGRGEALLASVVVKPDATNANPPPPAPLLDGAPAREGPCAWTIAPSGRHVVRTTFVEREPGETLIASHVVTGGTLEHQYAAVEPDAPLPAIADLEWTAPASGDVDLFVVLRDGRGGASFVRRRLCLR